MAIFRTKKVADFFLNEANPYSKKRSIKGWHVAGFFIVLAIVVLIVGSVLDEREQHRRQVEQAKLDAERAAKVVGGAPVNNGGSSQGDGYVDPPKGQGSANQGSSKNRNFSASQLIKSGDSVSDVLPMGTTIRVRLLGKVESSDAQSPVTGVLTEDAKSPAGFVVIPQGTKVIGQGSVDENRERLQVRFSAVVFPEGEQFSISALAAMPDGSSGIVGDYSSGQFKRHASQFVGNFIGGMADGLKDKQAAGLMGNSFEPGNLKNGTLNGLAQSSADYAKSSAEDAGQKSQASIRVENGQIFNLYLEREFHR
jgi:type IV secretory pathway VirB10-like protein